MSTLGGLKHTLLLSMGVMSRLKMPGPERRKGLEVVVLSTPYMSLARSQHTTYLCCQGMARIVMLCTSYMSLARSQHTTYLCCQGMVRIVMLCTPYMSLAHSPHTTHLCHPGIKRTLHEPITQTCSPVPVTCRCCQPARKWSKQGKRCSEGATPAGKHSSEPSSPGCSPMWSPRQSFAAL